MSLRDMLNNNSSIITIVAVVVLVVALGIIVMTNRGPQGDTSELVKDVYFYDLNTGKVFRTAYDQIPPIATPSGADAGVRAYIATCGACQDYTDLTAEEVKARGAEIVRLEKYSPQAIQALSGASVEIVMEDHTLTKRVQDRTWSPISGAGINIVTYAETFCNGDYPMFCKPGE